MATRLQKRFLLTAIVAVSAMSIFACTAQAELLLLDTFNNTQYADYYSGDDYGLNQELSARQSGTYATAEYSLISGNAAVNDEDFGQTLVLYRYNASTTVTLQQDFGHADDFTASVTVDPTISGYTEANWAALAVLGADGTPNNDSISHATDGGVVLLVLNNATWYLKVNGTAVSTGAVTATDSYQLSISVADDLVTASINGSAVVTDYQLTGAIASQTANYISLGTHRGNTTGYATFDNLQVTAVPEPSTIALLATGLIGLLAYAWRKRK